MLLYVNILLMMLRLLLVSMILWLMPCAITITISFVDCMVFSTRITRRVGNHYNNRMKRHIASISCFVASAPYNDDRCHYIVSYPMEEDSSSTRQRRILSMSSSLHLFKRRRRRSETLYDDTSSVASPNIVPPTTVQTISNSSTTTTTATTTTKSVGDHTDSSVGMLLNRNSSKTNIYVTASIELPFTADIAFAAFQDPIRQPSWSSWLQSVEYVDRIHQPNITKWTISVVGFKFSWIAQHTKLDPMLGLIEWQSASGLQNYGQVRFTPNQRTTGSITIDPNMNQGFEPLIGSPSVVDSSGCRMDLSMTFVPPPIIMRLLGGKIHLFQNFVEKKMLQATLLSFRQVVLENDITQQYELSH
jgi:uncharacterized membrane protein